MYTINFSSTYPYLHSIILHSKPLNSWSSHPPFPLLKNKGLHKAHCFQSKYNHLSRNSHICSHFDYFLVNYKAGNLCSCPLIWAPTKVAYYAQLFTRLRCTDSTAHSTDRTCSKQNIRAFLELALPCSKSTPSLCLLKLAK